MKIRENVPISELTTMRIGGAARYVIDIETIEDVRQAYIFARQHAGGKTYILGGGANTIGRDEGYDGAILVNKLSGYEFEGLKASAMGGVNWDEFVAAAAERGLTGIEAMSMIPGTVGAAPVQNIGAYGQEASDTITSVVGYDTESDEMVTIQAKDCKFGYRSSIFNNGEKAGRYFIVSVNFEFKEGKMEPPFYNSLQRYLDENGISDYSPVSIRKAVMAVRAEKLPDPRYEASAGSFFKNVYVDETRAAKLMEMGVPVRNGKVNTAWLIAEAGLAGKLLHGMRVSEAAPLVLINESARGYSDLAAARAEIIAAVNDKFGIRIEQEPVEILA